MMKLAWEWECGCYFGLGIVASFDGIAVLIGPLAMAVRWRRETCKRENVRAS